MYWMIDLHTHTLFSDGALLPFELARRAEAAGYRALAFTDHVDPSNIEYIVPALLKAAKELEGKLGFNVIPGAELTHVPPSMIAGLCARARELGAALVLVHGETLVEPVAQGTNRAAIEAGVDILAHPGLITPEEAALAARLGVVLEVTARAGHSLSNGHVVVVGRAAGATFVLNTDTHAPGDMVSLEFAGQVMTGAGMSNEEIKGAFSASENMVEKALGRMNA
jgi:histidinol phosphatase-like PHP family hydrolase